MKDETGKIYNINQRIIQILDYLSITRYRFSLETGISEAVLLNIYKGKNKPSFDAIEKILNIYKAIDAEWLLTGSGEMLKNKKSLEESKVPYEINKIKFIPFVRFGNLSEVFTKETQVYSHEDDAFVVPSFAEADFLFCIKSTDMSPRLSPGDIIACKKLPADSFFQWNKIYVLNTNQGAIIKRVKKGFSDETLLIVSENSDFETFELKRSQVLNIAQVLGVIRTE
jgi:repressor LexA